MRLRAASFRRTWGVALSLLFTVVIYIILYRFRTYLLEYWQFIDHLTLVIIAMIGVHLLDRLFLWKEIAEYLKESLLTSNPVLLTAEKSNLTAIYPNRHDMCEDLLKAVEQAKERVWLLGVAFSETIDIHSLFPLLIQQVGQIDIRILLLDPFRSPAIFRTLIESKQDTVYKIIQTDRTSSSAIDPFYKHPLYRAFNAAYEMLNEDDRLKPFVRFYGHNPNCWLVLIDKAVYYQPYTLGRKGPARSGNRCIGTEMPIFKFEQGVTPSTFEVLYDHTDKLWKTTNVDLFHMESRRGNRMRVLKDIFERRAVWLKHVYTMLYDQRNDRSMNIRPRRFPRRPCEAGRLTLSIKWEDAGQKNIIRIKEIRDCSYEGMQVQLEPPTALLRKEMVVSIDGIGAVRSPVAAQMLRSLSDRCNNRFSVVWTDDQNTLAGLRVVAVT